MTDDHTNSAAGYASEERAGGAAVRDGASKTAPATPPARVGIVEQAEEVAREVRQRERLYPKWIADRRLKQDTADAKLAALRAAHATLETVARHADGLRLLIQYLRRRDAYAGDSDPPEPICTEAEAELLLQQPAVRALCAVFPDAILSTVRPMETPDL